MRGEGKPTRAGEQRVEYNRRPRGAASDRDVNHSMKRSSHGERAMPEQKTCIRCGQTKALREMHQTRLRVYGYCRKCLYLAQQMRWNRQKVRAVEHLGGACVACGFRGHPALFDFDHRDRSSKQFSWNKLRLRSWDSICKELEKCDLLCCACHRLRHLNPAVWPPTK